MKTYKFLGMVLAVAVSPSIMAQDAYDVQNLTTSDLNGTARYVGMGGAMSALGADISVMSVNPAGIGLYRRNDAAATISVLNAPNAPKVDGHGKTSFSWDNAGFVYSYPAQSGSLKYINFGFNYKKLRNFNQNYSAMNEHLDGILADGMSQNGQLAYQNYDVGATDEGFWSTNLSEGAYKAGIIGYDKTSDTWQYKKNAAYEYYKAQWGGVQEFDFNMSFNIDHRVYLGLTIGAYNVNYHGYSEYSEFFYDKSNGNAFTLDYNLFNDNHIYGGGMDVKFGIIARPVENSPFRIGLAVSTPTYYWLSNESRFGYVGEKYAWYPGVFDFNLTTPWKLNASIGHTVGDYLALGAEYEYQGNGSTKIGYGDDAWSDNDSYYTDQEMTYLVKNALKKGTHTFKLGAEVKVADGLSLRAGYNYVTTSFEDGAFRDQLNDSEVRKYATNSTDYMNTSAINRFTCGLGYRGRNWYADIAYQYSHQTGDFYAFDDSYISAEQDVAYKAYLTPEKVKLNRSQFLFTLGYKF